jgi:hypothetical protein
MKIDLLVLQKLNLNTVFRDLTQMAKCRKTTLNSIYELKFKHVWIENSNKLFILYYRAHFKKQSLY